MYPRIADDIFVRYGHKRRSASAAHRRGRPALRYAERLLGEPVTPYEELPTDAKRIFAVADTAFAKLKTFLDTAKEEDWKVVIEFPTRSAGTLSASRKKIFIHSLLHSIRHWAHLATALRVAGFKQDWQHDFLMSETMK